ncbi:hypothetical protein ASPFODRAFT_278339 [Aspergillus luchuensis CBS 106.47]|uniref:Uncharacterized protein n=1 Tax=Aspergillus luchuensis (strain CBS 106.47) TaxID=1137211 RepID=A0A1M3U1K5_ASPLC|nr:hypothetical protein ASPFODRAFT_278339 [Aspergillus luchuensis CBS 106.47]
MSTLVALTCLPGHSRSSFCSVSFSYSLWRPETLRSARVFRFVLLTHHEIPCARIMTQLDANFALIRMERNFTCKCSRTSPIHQSVAPNPLDTSSNTFVVVKIFESYGSRHSTHLPRCVINIVYGVTFTWCLSQMLRPSYAI